MLFTYCKACGHKNLYTLHKPKFCSGCGCAIDSSAASQKKPTQVKARPRPRLRDDDIEEEQDFGEEINELPDISKIKCSISKDYSSGRKIALSDLVRFDQVAQSETMNNEQEG